MEKMYKLMSKMELVKKQSGTKNSVLLKFKTWSSLVRDSSSSPMTKIWSPQISLDRPKVSLTLVLLKPKS